MSRLVEMCIYPRSYRDGYSGLDTSYLGLRKTRWDGGGEAEAEYSKVGSINSGADSCKKDKPEGTGKEEQILSPEQNNDKLPTCTRIQLSLPIGIWPLLRRCRMRISSRPHRSLSLSVSVSSPSSSSGSAILHNYINFHTSHFPQGSLSPGLQGSQGNLDLRPAY